MSIPSPQNLQRTRDLERRRELLYKLLQSLQQDFDLETHSDEKFRLQNRIDEKNRTLQKVEAELQDEKLANLYEDLLTLKRNRAYSQALDVARQIQNTNPNHQGIDIDIQNLQEKLAHKEHTTQALGQLMSRISELGMPFYQQIARVLNPQNQHDDSSSLLLATEQYLKNSISTEIYKQICQPLLASHSSPQATTQKVNYPALSRNILAGDIILFLGSDIPHLYENYTWDEHKVAHKLAQAINYKNFKGNLPSIAELYQLRQLEYGQKSLIKNLHQQLPNNLQHFPLYTSLAQSDENLILISSAYDNLLEQAFLIAKKPFVELSSIIHRSKNHDVGHVVVNFSDDDKDEIIYPQEELSKLNLLDKYTLIYKIRGTCATHHPQSARKYALTLSESNYFTLAENANKIVPDALAGHLLERAFLFVGFTPCSWEDRLLARILLNKRRTSSESCYTLSEPDDPLQHAYWQQQQVEYFHIDFQQLDAYLQGVKA